MDQRVPEPQDLVGMKSRISWGAIFGGSVIALTVYVVLTLLFAGVGLSLTEANVRSPVVNAFAVIAAVLSVILANFVGGWVTTQLTVGEDRREAVIHGILTWATVTGLAVLLALVGFRGGYNALLGASLIADRQVTLDEATWAFRNAGISPEKIDQLRANATPHPDPSRIDNAVADDKAQERKLMVATWSILVGTVLAMGAAAFGALVGAGPVFRFLPVVLSNGRRGLALTPS